MKLDREEDRKFLLAVIAESNFKGAASFIVSDIVTRIQNATVEGPAPAAKPELVEDQAA